MPTPKQVTHVSLYLTQNQARRVLALLEANPRKVDAAMVRHVRAGLEKAAAGDVRHAQWHEQLRASHGDAP